MQAHMNVHHVFQQIDLLIYCFELIIPRNKSTTFNPARKQPTDLYLINFSTQRPNQPNLPPQIQHDNRKKTLQDDNSIKDMVIFHCYVFF